MLIESPTTTALRVACGSPHEHCASGSVSEPHRSMSDGSSWSVTSSREGFRAGQLVVDSAALIWVVSAACSGAAVSRGAGVTSTGTDGTAEALAAPVDGSATATSATSTTSTKLTAVSRYAGVNHGKRRDDRRCRRRAGRGVVSQPERRTGSSSRWYEYTAARTRTPASASRERGLSPTRVKPMMMTGKCHRYRE